jgi:hypothetical protein
MVSPLAWRRSGAAVCDAGAPGMTRLDMVPAEPREDSLFNGGQLEGDALPRWGVACVTGLEDQTE